MEIRIDPITQQSSILATQRAKRPHFGSSKTPHPPLDKHRSQAAKVDPFAEGSEQVTDPEVWVDTDQPDRLPNTPGWKIRVIPNKYPIVDHHEVIILTPDQHKGIANQSQRQAERIVRAYLARSKEHQKKGNIFIFVNSGAQAGASIKHPHAQLMVFPSLPPTVAVEVAAVDQHFKDHGQCLYCDMIARELRIGHRIIWQNEDFLLVCPEASGWPYAIMLLPKVHQPNFAMLKEEQIKPLAEAMRVMLQLYDHVLENPPYNYWVHSVQGKFFHWHLELIPRTKILAGVELGAGIMVNDRIAPEDAAAQFRNALKVIKG